MDTDDKAKKLKDLEDHLSRHDWFYQYSDDYSIYERGHRSWSSLVTRCNEVPVEDLRPLWMKYAPAQYREMFDRLFG